MFEEEEGGLDRLSGSGETSAQCAWRRAGHTLAPLMIVSGHKFGTAEIVMDMQISTAWLAN